LAKPERKRDDRDVSQDAAAPVDDFVAALKNGTPDVDVITGFEYKHRDDPTSPGQQFSIRTRVGYRSAEFLNTAAYVQLHNVSNVMEEYRFMYEGKMRGDLDRDIIADPDGSRFQEAYLDFSFIPDTVVRVGRQEIILDDARLIGNIDWRLNGQSFDAASITNTSIPDVKLYAAYVQQVNTILLDGLDLDGMWLFNAGYSGIKNHHLSVYTYLLDTESELDTARDSATYGFRFSGKTAPFSYYLDYSHQSDFADGEDHEADMLNLYLAGDLGYFTLGGGYSYISGQDGTDRSFDTLFSTAHKFNGFADQFLGTNGGGLTAGLQDYYAQAVTKLFDAKLVFAYHFFDSAEDDNAFDGTYGDEFDALLVKPVAENLTFIAKYANFMQDDSTASGNPTRDTEILSVRLRYKF
jgi:hypothetical protein